MQKTYGTAYVAMSGKTDLFNGTVVIKNGKVERLFTDGKELMIL